jgi:hypothetical protein
MTGRMKDFIGLPFEEAYLTAVWRCPSFVTGDASDGCLYRREDAGLIGDGGSSGGSLADGGDGGSATGKSSSPGSDGAGG